MLNIPIMCPKIFFNNKIQTSKFDEWIGKDFEKLNIILTYNLIYNAAIMAEADIGYILTMDKLVNNSEGLCFVPLKPKLEIESRVIWKKNQIFSEASKVFLGKLRKEIDYNLT